MTKKFPKGNLNAQTKPEYTAEVFEGLKEQPEEKREIEEGKTMYPNLEAEMARRGIKRKTLAKATGIGYSTLSSKMNGKGMFRLPDMKKIKSVIGVEMPMEELFEESEQVRR